MNEFEAITHKWMNAFNTQQLSDLLALYDDAAEHYSPKLKVLQPETKGYIKGKAALGLWWSDAFRRLPHLNYELINTSYNSEQIFMEYIRHNPGEDDLRVAEVLVVRNGLIVASRVYHS